MFVMHGIKDLEESKYVFIASTIPWMTNHPLKGLEARIVKFYIQV